MLVVIQTGWLTGQDILSNLDQGWNGSTVIQQLHEMDGRLIGTALVPGAGGAYYQEIDPATGSRGNLTEPLDRFSFLRSGFDLNNSRILERGGRRFALLNKLSEGELLIAENGGFRSLFETETGYKLLAIDELEGDVAVVTYNEHLQLMRLVRVSTDTNGAAPSRLTEVDVTYRGGAFLPSAEIATGEAGLFVSFKSAFDRSRVGYYSFATNTYREILGGTTQIPFENNFSYKELEDDQRRLVYHDGAAYIIGGEGFPQPIQAYRILESNLQRTPIPLAVNLSDDIFLDYVSFFRDSEELYVSATRRGFDVRDPSANSGRIARISGATLENIHSGDYTEFIPTIPVVRNDTIVYAAMDETGVVTVYAYANGITTEVASVTGPLTNNYDLFVNEDAFWLASNNERQGLPGATFTKIDLRAGTAVTSEALPISTRRLQLFRNSYAVVDGVVYYLKAGTSEIGRWDPAATGDIASINLQGAQIDPQLYLPILADNNDDSDFLAGSFLGRLFTAAKTSGGNTGLISPEGFAGDFFSVLGPIGDTYLVNRGTNDIIYIDDANPGELKILQQVVNEEGQTITLEPGRFATQYELSEGRYFVSDFDDQLGYGGSWVLTVENGVFRAFRHGCVPSCSQLPTPEGRFELTSRDENGTITYTVIAPDGTKTVLSNGQTDGLRLIGTTPTEYYFVTPQQDMEVYDRASGERQSFAPLRNNLFIDQLRGSETVGNDLYVVGSAEDDEVGSIYLVDPGTSQLTFVAELPATLIDRVEDLESTDGQLIVVGERAGALSLYTLRTTDNADLEPVSVPLGGLVLSNTTIPAYASLGDQFVYTGDWPDGTNLYRIVGTEEPQLLANLPQIGTGGKAYNLSADGEDLYFMAHAADDGFFEVWRLPMGLSVSINSEIELGGAPPVIYPNPASTTDLLTVQAPENHRINRVEVFATDGRRLLDRAANGQTAVRLSLATLPAAQYWVRTTYASGRFALSGVVRAQ
ncbi:hypothetical protein A3850_003560 [Lewinella sp. 4G2]|nr:hypothetical protein A3850_003560 [Lewinella sp. 4G2]